MTVVKLESFSPDHIGVQDPVKQEELYLSKITYNEADLVLQTPKLKVRSISMDNIELILNDEMIKFLETYDKYMINTISTHSDSWFSKELTKNQVSQFYKKSTVDDYDNDTKYCNFKVSDIVKIYSRTRDSLEVSDVEIGSEVIILVSAPYLVFYKSNCIPYWESLHIKIKEPKVEYNVEFRETEDKLKQPKIKLEEFGIN